ncbi:sphingosine N-acyltransferase lag1 [Tulasnella sp. 403]|nr:sphingosine N-acyltransferase lag1 [Tulasnella sp. 403]
MTPRILQWPSSWEWVPSAFFRLSYPIDATSDFFPNSQHYAKGWADVLFVFTWAVLFALLREILMRGVFAPFIRRWLARTQTRAANPRTRQQHSNANGKHDDEHANGNCHANGYRPSYEKSSGRVRSRNGSASTVTDSPPSRHLSRQTRRFNKILERKATRFAEQGWSVAYYIVYWSFGYYIHYHSPWYPFNLERLWIGWPHVALPREVKFYYLSQLAFWLNQIVILNVEERRKDHLQMMSHHIITTTLMMLSYCMDYTRVGCLILVLFDLCDILLPLAKMLKYMGLEPLPDIIFTLFLVLWFLTRQGLYSFVVLSVVRDAPRLLPEVHPRVWVVYTILLGSLGVLVFVWFIMIARIAINVVRGKPAEDTRSDDEGDDSEDAEAAKGPEKNH